MGSLCSRQPGWPPGVPQSLEIGGSPYKVLRLLGEGAYGHVLLAHHTPTGDMVAIKVMTHEEDDASYRNDLRECRLLEALQGHPNLVEYRAHQVISRNVYLVEEYCPHSLVAEMNAHVRAQTRFEEAHIWRIFRDLVSGISHCHAQSPHPITHRDVKVENILQTNDGRYVLCDFGSATSVAYEPSTPQEITWLSEELFPKIFTMQYQPPEALDLWSRQRVDTHVDVWALGCVLYYIILLKAPFEGSQRLAIINSSIHNMPQPQSAMVSAELWAMVQWLLIPNPKERPNIFDVARRLHEIRPDVERVVPEGPCPGQLPQPLWKIQS